MDVTSICDVTPSNLENACNLVEEKRGKRPEALGGDLYAYHDLLRSDEIDCVVIATPCNWHWRMYVDALEADMHFYGEKPLAITATEVKEVQAAREDHPDVVVQIGFQWGAHQGRADVVGRARAGEIGELIEGRFARHNSWGSLGRWFNDRKLSGDWMLEQAVHEFNLMWWVLGEHPVSAYTLGRINAVEPDNHDRNVTDFYATVLEYPKGVTVQYSHGWISPPGFAGMTTKFVGTKGGLDVLGCFLRLQGEDQDRPGEGAAGDTPEHLQNFFDAVRAGRPDMTYCGIENGVAASYVGLLIRKSLYEKRRVIFEEMVDDPQEPSPLVVV